MRNSLGQLNVAHHKNLKLVEQPRQKSVSHQRSQPCLQNKIYLQSSTKMSGVHFNRQKLIEQNQKLKKQVLDLAGQLKSILSKSQKKKKYGMNHQEDLSPEGEVQRLEVNKQQAKILQLKNQIFNLKKENQFVWDEPLVIEKQNAIKALEAEIRPLETQRAAFIKVRKEQQKALNSLNFLKNDEKYSQKIEKSKAQLSKLKQQCKGLIAKTQENEKLLLKSHQRTINKNRKIKEIEQKIKDNKEKIKKGPQNVVTMEMISEIEEQITRLESEYKQAEKEWIEKIGNLDVEYNNRKIEEEKKLIILKDKEREVRLNDIRLRQFRKLMVHSRTDSKFQGAEDMREFRNKRNIKFFSKGHS